MDPILSRREWLRRGTAAGAGLLVAPSAPATVAPTSESRRLRPVAADEIEDRLRELVAKYRVPGAIAAVSTPDGQVHRAAFGIANANTNAPMTPDLAFIAGSITKVWTTTLLMTFVDDGTVALDRPLVRSLPHLRFRDPTATRVVTLRHLLNHSSGVDMGDYFLDRGEGPCAHRIFVDTLARIGQIHPPGVFSSYCNGGFVVAAHLLETLTGKTWHQLLFERVIAPMALPRTYVDAEDAILYGMVVGSHPDRSSPAGFRATPKLLLPRTMAAAGTTLVFNATDLLAFARMHLAGGVADNGRRILSEASARAMANRTIEPPVGPVAGFGLGWMHAVVDGRTVLSHSGGSNGGRSQVVVLPDLKLVHASFVNSSAPGDLQSELHDWLTGRFGTAGARSYLSATITPPNGPIDPTPFLGTFRRTTVRSTIRREGTKLVLESESIPAEAEGLEAYGPGGTSTSELVAVSPTALAPPGATTLSRSSGLMFLDPDAKGRFRLMFSGGRLARRIA